MNTLKFVGRALFLLLLCVGGASVFAVVYGNVDARLFHRFLDVEQVTHVALALGAIAFFVLLATLTSKGKQKLAI